jgi:hypothetical protein
MYFVASNASGLSLSDFIANAAGFYFAADIIGPSGNTGEVAVKNAPSIVVSAPEPASIVSFGAGLLALGAAARARPRARSRTDDLLLKHAHRHRTQPSRHDILHETL